MEATAVVDGDEVVRQRPQVVVHRRRPPRLQGPHLHGPHRPRTPTATTGTRWCSCRCDTPGVKVERMLSAMGHVRRAARPRRGDLQRRARAAPATILAGPGAAFEIAQGRLGPGRVHHCMRLIGLAEMALELACERGLSRTAFGKPLANLGGNRERIADARIAIDQARLLVLHAAWKLDTGGPRTRSVEVGRDQGRPCRTMAQRGHRHGDPAARRRRACREDFPLAAAVDRRPRAAPGRRARRGAPRRRRPARAAPVRRPSGRSRRPPRPPPWRAPDEPSRRDNRRVCHRRRLGPRRWRSPS